MPEKPFSTRGLVIAGLLAWGSTAAPVFASGGNDHLEMSRGFGIDTAFASETIDSINLFNGNLVLNVPMGGQLQAGRISYGFNAVYNSRNWDFVVRCVVGGSQCYDWSIPAVSSNAGNGWVVTFGQLYQPWREIPDAPSWPNLSESDFVYIAPDGSSHVLACEPAAGHGCGTVWYSSSLQIRLREISSTEMRLDFANGNVHRFEKMNWAGCPLSNVYSSCWLLTRIYDTYGNFVDLTYHKFSDRGPHISISDSFDRRHHVQYKSSPADKNAPAAYQYVVDYVIVNDHSSSSQTYSFEYLPKTIDREYPHSFFTGEPAGADVQVPLLTGIGGPESQTYGFGYVISGSRNSGVLDYYRIPTGGEVSFGYGDWVFPKACDINLFVSGTGGIPHFDNYQKSLLRGVVSRTVNDPSGPDGTTTYSGIAENRWYGNPGESGCQRPRWFQTEVQYPATSAGLRPKEVHWYSVATKDEGNWKRAEYGLPINKDKYFDTSAAGRVYRSAEIYECSTFGSCTHFSNIYRRYATRFVSQGDFCEIGDSPACGRRDSILVAEHQTFLDDSSAYRGTLWRDYDGLGNFREIAQYSGGFAGPNDWRYTIQDFNDTLDGYVTQNIDTIAISSGFFSALPNISSHYTLNEYSKIEIYDDSFGKRTDFCFNTEGDVIGVRRRVSRSSTSDALGIFYERNTLGQIIEEHHGISQSNVCGTPSNATTLVHTYDSYGNLTSSRYSGHDEYELEREFSSAGYVVKEWNPSGVQTSYSRDLLGRPTRITTGTTTATSINYSNTQATATRGDLSVTLKVDGFGRPKTEERRSLPGGQTLITSLTYDSAGNLTGVDQGAAHRSWSNDSRGRLLEAVGVDSSVTAYSYIGERVRNAVNEEVTTAYFDAYGQIREVEMGKGSVFGSPAICMEYEYDVEGRLRVESRYSGSCNSGSKQTKRHEYDGRGFLTEQQTSEAGTVQYDNFDPLGNPGTVNRPGKDLSMAYNVRGQVTSVSHDGQPLVEYEYGQSGCGAGSYCLGQVTLARRHNRINGYDFTIETSSTYNGPAGEVTSTRISAQYPDGGYGTTATHDFVINREFDAAGRLDSLVYPSCAGCPNDPDREISYGYEYALLTSIGGASLDDINVDFLYNTTGVLDFIGYHGFTTAYSDLNRRNGFQLDYVAAGSGGQTFWHSGQFRYDDAGRITNIGNDYYEYDDLGRIRKSNFKLHDQRSANAEFTYDAFDNIESRSTSVAGVNSSEQFSPSSATNRLTDSEFEYDTDGHLFADACRNYDFDALGMLRTTSQKTFPESGCSAGNTYHYLYDADNQRVLSICDECSNLALEVNLRVSPEAVAPGGQVTLSWDPVEGAESCEAFDGWSGQRSVSGGSQTISLAGDTRFGLRCTAGNQVEEDVAIGDVFAPEFSFEASANSVDVGGSVTLEWSAAQYAESCTASGGWTGIRSVSGGIKTVTVTEPTAYLLTCAGAGGNTQISVFVDVNFPEPEFTFTLNGQDGNGLFLPNQTATFQWSDVRNADKCFLTASGIQSGHTLTIGEVSVAGGTTSTSVGDFNRGVGVTLECRNAFKSRSHTLSYFVSVNGAPVLSFWAFPNKYSSENGYPKLRWYAWRVNNCWPSGGGWTPEDVGVPDIPAGEFEVRPTVDTSYSMKCRGPFGETEQSTTVLGTKNVLVMKSAQQDAPIVLTDPLRISVSWSFNGLGHEGFRILRRQFGASAWHVAGTVSADARDFVDTNISYSRDYEYAIRAYAGNEVGEISNILQVSTPPAPQPSYWLVSKNCVPENGCSAVNGGETFDYPSVLQGNAASRAKFVIDNQSTSSTLGINVDLSTTDWRIAKAADSSIGPGGRTFLELNIDTAAAGRRETTVSIHTNDPARPVVSFTLVRNVLAEAGKLVIVKQPGSVEALPGTQPKLSVAVDGGSGDYGYEWNEFKCIVSPCGPYPIAPDDPRYDGIGTDTIIVHDLAHGEYHTLLARVWDKQNPDTIEEIYSSWGSVTAIGVKILGFGPSQFVMEGNATTLAVNAIGYGTLKYEWYGPGGRLVDDWNYAGTASPLLTIRNANPGIEGEYSVAVSNEYGDRWGTAHHKVRVVPMDIELAHAFGTGLVTDELIALNGQSLNVGDVSWFASPLMASNSYSLRNSAPVSGVSRAGVLLPRSTRDAQVELTVETDLIAPGNGSAADPQLEFGVGRFTAGIDGAYSGLSVHMTNPGVLQIVRNGTDVMVTGNSADCGWNPCTVTLILDTARGTADVFIESQYAGNFKAASVNGLRNLDDGDTAFIGFIDSNNYDGSLGGWGFGVRSAIVDVDPRPNIVPMLYILQ